MIGTKPCPWCHGQRLWVWEKTPGHAAIACSNPSCAATGPLGRDIATALQLWNEAPRDARRLVSSGLRQPSELARAMAEMNPVDIDDDLVPRR